jgi:hypothetical protein
MDDREQVNMIVNTDTKALGRATEDSSIPAMGEESPFPKIGSSSLERLVCPDCGRHGWREATLEDVEEEVEELCPNCCNERSDQ